MGTKIDKIKVEQDKIVIDDNLRKSSSELIDYTMDGSVKQLFLNLTKMQIPFDYEKTLEDFFPDEMGKDEHGNYHLNVGEGKTMFCGHLDTYCYEHKKVWHVIDGDIIKTDGTTTLGGDDKAGITIMIKMIEAGVPGLYYFFRGEEGVTSPTGTWGSKQALRTYKDVFATYDRCIAFDRKGTSSIITKQMYSTCCSTKFAEKLIEEFSKSDLIYVKDDTGMKCDSGVFTDVIPECTNISVGYVNEHTFNESQNISHLEKLVNACINTDWESLPVDRDPSVPSYDYTSYYKKYPVYNSKDYNDDYHIYNKPKTKQKSDIFTIDELFREVTNLLYGIGYNCINPDGFRECEEMYFQHNRTLDFFGLKIIDFDIMISTDSSLVEYEYIGDISNFESYISMGNNYIKSENDTKSVTYNSKDDFYESNDKNFTDIQHKTFNIYVKNNTDMLLLIMDSISRNKDIILSSSDWIKINTSFFTTGIVDDIENGDEDINPDSLAQWVDVYWDKCKQILVDEKTEKDKKPIDEKLRSGVNNIFTTKQINTYTDICLNKIPKIVLSFIQLVIRKGFVDKEENYSKYEKTINTWIVNSGYRITNEIEHDSFLEWLIFNSKDIEEYNG